MARTSRYSPSGRRAASRAADAVSKLPVNTVLPAITGTTTQGQILTCSNGTWSKSPSYTRIWLRDGVPISGASAATYVLALADVGKKISCSVIAANSGVSAVATSAQTATIAAS